jgi:hypothetical protein
MNDSQGVLFRSTSMASGARCARPRRCWRADHPPNRAVTELGALTVHDLHNPPTDRHPERRIAYGAVLRIR